MNIKGCVLRSWKQLHQQRMLTLVQLAQLSAKQPKEKEMRLWGYPSLSLVIYLVLCVVVCCSFPMPYSIHSCVFV